MKICFVVNNYPPRMGGLESHVHNLARELVHLGHTITVITLADTAGDAVEDGIRVIRYREVLQVAGVLGFPAWGFSRWLRRTLAEVAPDAVSVHTRFFTLSYLGVRAARSLGIPVIHTEHGSGYVASDSFIIGTASRAVDHTMGRYVLRHSDAVLGVSEEVTAFVRRLSGVSAEVFYNAIAESPRPEPIPAGQIPDLVFIGRLVPGKGWDVALEAAALLEQSAPGRFGTLHILGDGADREAAQERVQELGLSDRVHLHGRVSPEQVREIVRHSVYLNPTVLSEGFQTTLLEAAAEDAQIVSYPVPGVTQLVAEGAPIRVAEERSAEALLPQIIAALDSPLPGMSAEALARWTWPQRGIDYERIVASVTGATR